MLPVPALAQNAQRLQLAPASDRHLSIAGTHTLDNLDWLASVTLHYLRNPVSLRDADSGEVSFLVRQLPTLDLSAAVGMGERSQLSVHVPIVYAQGQALAGETLRGGELGDIWLTPRVRLTDRDFPVGIGFSLPVSLPTGAPEHFTGDKEITLHPRLSADAQHGAFGWAVNAGVVIRRQLDMLVYGTRQNEFSYGIGGNYVVGRSLWASLEVTGAVGLGESRDLYDDPLEILAGATWQISDDFTLRGGLGTALVEHFGAPDLRAIVGIGYSPAERADPPPPPSPPPLPPPDPQPVADRDGDQVVDSDDRCPDVPGAVALAGCPERTLVTLRTERIEVLEPIMFNTDSDELAPSSARILDQVVSILRHEHPQGSVRVEGHTDAVGSRLYNIELSQRRAEAVVRYLVAHGVEAARLSGHGFGFDRPIASNRDARGRAQNRRVDFILSTETSK
jgi:outer membrane protein OmpA-like peptidoglycan-associated protein